MSKSFIFLVKSILGNFYRHLAIFIWSHWTQVIGCCVNDKPKIITEQMSAPFLKRLIDYLAFPVAPSNKELRVVTIWRIIFANANFLNQNFAHI